MAKKEKPVSVKVGVFTYTIKYSSKEIEKRLVETGEKVSGFCDKEARIIVVDPKTSVQSQQEILMHEILHACFELVASGIDSPTEENFVHFGAPVLLQVLKDNNEIREFLTNDSSNYE